MIVLKRNLAVVLGSLTVCSLLLAIVLIYYLFSPIKKQGDPLVVPIGASTKSIARSLKQVGVIKATWPFTWYARLTHQDKQFQAGEYDLSQKSNLYGIIQKLKSGQVIQYPFTIIEGWTLYQLLDALQLAPNLRKTVGLQNYQELITHFEMFGQENLEGLFLPDTYFYHKGATDLDILKRANTALKQLLISLWANRDPSLVLKSPYEALILASIVEKETAIYTELAKVSGVYLRRLEKKMRLQADPTVIYGLKDKFSGLLSRQDLKIDTPYNTYLHKGLPPTPIAMAGSKAIMSLFSPDLSDNLYFVATQEGYHIFSDNLTDHNQARFEIKEKNKSFK